MRRMIAEAVAVIALGVVAWLAISSCTTSDAIEGATGESLQETLDRECRERGLICARVYEFSTPADNPLGLVEMCVREEDLALAESIYGDSMWTSHERFDRYYAIGVEPMCVWCAGFGCNAYGSPSPTPAPSCFNCPGEP